MSNKTTFRKGVLATLLSLNRVNWISPPRCRLLFQPEIFSYRTIAQSELV